VGGTGPPNSLVHKMKEHDPTRGKKNGDHLWGLSEYDRDRQGEIQDKVMSKGDKVMIGTKGGPNSALC